MTNPYEILGVRSDSSKAEIDSAYNHLMTEYRNSGNSDCIAKEIADYKIQEITTAYNQLINQCNDSTLLGNTVSEVINPYYSPTNNLSTNVHNKVNDMSKTIPDHFDYPENNTDNKKSENQNAENNQPNDPNDIFGSVRQFIELGRYSEAENLLNSISYKDTAVWHYLYGKMCFGRGWMNQAAVHFQRAYTLEPSNEQYKQDSIQINKMKMNSSKIPKAVIAGGVAVMALRICSYTAPILVDVCDDL